MRLFVVKHQLAILIAGISAIASAPGRIVYAQAQGADESAAPQILVDGAHHNLLYAEMGAGMLQYISSFGYETSELTGTVDSEALDGVDVLVISMALAERNAPPTHLLVEGRVEEFLAARDAAFTLPTPSAFSKTEIDIIREWVSDGGALLLAADHMPMSGAAADLARAFGVEISNGFVLNASQLPESFTELDDQITGRAGAIVFSTEDESLSDSFLTRGGGDLSSVDSVLMLTGSALQLPPDGESILTFGEGFVSFLTSAGFRISRDTPRQSVEGWSQGGLLRYGLGRVAIFGEASILVASDFIRQQAASAGLPNAESLNVQNTELLRNVFEWLLGRTEDTSGQN